MGSPLLSPTSLARARKPIGQATTLPATAFTDPAVYERECERIFRREWICAGRVDQVPEPGDYRTFDFLDEKLVVVRDESHEIRVLSRVCRHRGADMLQGSGNAKSLVCPYHSWSYRHDGTLLGAPHMAHVEALDRASCRLPAFRSEIWEGWIFVNLDPGAEPLGPRLAPLSRFLARYGMGDKVAVATATFPSPFNWKILVDNFMEAYHHIAIHRQSLEPAFPGARSWVPDNEGPYSLLVMPTVNAREPADVPNALDEEDPDALVAGVVYPFHLFAPSRHTLAWYQLRPEAHDRFMLDIFTCFPRDTLESPDQVSFATELIRSIHHEDIAACESTWSGLHSPTFEAGPLCPLEKTIWQFNQWWIDRMEIEA